MDLATRIKWLATGITLVGAVFASLNFYPLGPALLNAGGLTFLVWAIMIRDRAMITVNLGITLIYTVGLLIKLL